MKYCGFPERAEKIRNSKATFGILWVMYKLLPLGMVAAYPVMLTVKGFMKIDLDFYLMIAVPACTLVLITLMRKFIRRERPYEKYNFSPLFDRDGTKDSFPSRHTASAFIIAMSAFAISHILCAALLAVAVLIGLSRILAGVHFISDVLAGMLISVLAGIIAFIII